MNPEERRALGIGTGTLADKERAYTLDPQPKADPPEDFTCIYCGAHERCDLPICEAKGNS